MLFRPVGSVSRNLHPVEDGPIAAGEENDGASRWWTDSNGTRRRYLMDGQPASGAGFTNLNAASLTGTVPTATLPGITTNISASGVTFYITNGLIMRVTTP